MLIDILGFIILFIFCVITPYHCSPSFLNLFSVATSKIGKT